MNSNEVTRMFVCAALAVVAATPGRAEEANLEGVFNIVSVGLPQPTAGGFNWVFYYGTLNAEVGMNISDISADGVLGGTGADQSTSSEYIHFDSSNSGDFARFIQHLTNDVEEAMWVRGINFGPDGVITSMGSPNQLLEQVGLTSRFGSGEITFARFVVGMSAGSGGTTSLQFFSGESQINGGAQSAEVDRFITFSWPLEKTTTWYWVSKPQIGLTITYGPSINPATFQATLNREPLAGFNPVPGTTQTVNIPVTSGRSTLVISVEGAKTGGGTATDTDRLTIIGI